MSSKIGLTKTGPRYFTPVVSKRRDRFEQYGGRLPLGGYRYGFDSNLWHKKHFLIIDFTNCLMLIIHYFERTCEIVSLIPPCFV